MDRLKFSSILLALMVLLAGCTAEDGDTGSDRLETGQATSAGLYPHDVVTLITHSSPGGGSDVFLRELIRHLGPQMGVDFVVENVRGGGGCAGDEPACQLTCERQRFSTPRRRASSSRR